MSATPAATPLTDLEYLAKTRAMLDRIEAKIDEWLDSDIVDIDSHRSGGLLELSLPGGSKIILNTQAPLQELWMAARAGGFHFRYVDGLWLDTKTGAEFLGVLATMASAQSGQPLSFSV